ncbi:MAG: hypothetical protein BIFFINMI_00274 [Phycisphaerae bacterium]|nr:hypothetical protein [Phycisphaerae bacterium]
MQEIDYRDWKGCVRLANRHVELIATTAVGPRIIHLAPAGGENLFFVDPTTAGATGGDEWRIYGGHRLWHAPEQRPRTYCPDNGPVSAEPIDGGMRLTQPVEPATGIEKRMDVQLAPDAAEVRVAHRLTNRGPWAVTLAPWAISVLAGGVAVLPLPPRGPQPENLAPDSMMAAWAYLDMTDPRWTWGRRYVLLAHDASAAAPQKTGLRVTDGWCAAVVGGTLLIKSFAYDAAAEYPDFGCTVESFTNADILELETLGPLVELAPGASAEHVETWRLFPNVPPPTCDADVERDLLPRI